jgi:hypothetical protein
MAVDYDQEVANYAKNPNNIDVCVSLKRFEPTGAMQDEFQVDSSRFIATEGLIKPKRWGLDVRGLHQLIFDAVQLAPIDSRRTLYR